MGPEATTLLAHIAGLPVEESLLYAAPLAGLWLVAAAAHLGRLRALLRRAQRWRGAPARSRQTP